MPPAMFHVPPNFVCFTVIIHIQIIILTFGYGFLGAVAYFEYLAPSDSVCELMRSHPGELTMIVTLIATVLSVTAATSVYLWFSTTDHSVRCGFFTSLFTLSVKEALRHRMWKPISLVHLSTGVALAQGSHIFKRRYIGLTILTLFIFGMLRLLTAGYVFSGSIVEMISFEWGHRWTTLLTPNYFMWPVQLNGTELDITGSAFATLLREEFLAHGLTDSVYLCSS
jgi:hypothetical protein